MGGWSTTKAMLRHGLAGITLMSAVAASAAESNPDPQDAIATLLGPALYGRMEISPDGKRLAAIRYDKSIASVLLIDIDTLTAHPLVGSTRFQSERFTRVPISARWIGNELLAVDFNDRVSAAFDTQGKFVCSLGERFIKTFRHAGAESDSALVVDDGSDGDIARVNVRNCEYRKYRVSLPGKLLHWAFDGSGVLRAVTTRDTAFWSDRTKVSNWYRPDESSPWQLLEEAPITEGYWQPLHVPAEADSLVVMSRHERDTSAVFRYDVRLRKHVELMAAHVKEDISIVTGLDRQSFDTVRTEGLKPKIFWFDERWAALQASVDSALPGRMNTLSGDPKGRVLVHSYSDIDPGRWLVLDTANMAMKQIARAKPSIDPKKMRPMEALEYRSPDGLVIPAYLTRPSDAAGPAPLVVLIHGGPHMRDHWGWDEEVQLLAAQGYAVFQPQFRGSTGFGRRFQEEGYGQWGLAMQDDITAGVQHLVERKIADPKRICIYGKSYGGYAALWGLVKTPSLYKCGISFAGVSDIEYMLQDGSDRNNDAVVRELQRARIGDPAAGKQQFADVSPLKHAARIEAALFIAHGEDDERVPVWHSRKMVAALQDQGKTVESRFFEGERHGLRFTRNRRQYYADLLNFLKRHIGDPVR